MEGLRLGVPMSFSGRRQAHWGMHGYSPVVLGLGMYPCVMQAPSGWLTMVRPDMD